MMQDIMADPTQSSSDYMGLVNSLVGIDGDQPKPESE